jgi:4-hydroxy-tetrahydrodipicolinate synthase
VSSGRLPPLGRGLWGVLATPFAGGELSVDEVSLRREVSLFRELGATGVVALGVFGEAVSLDAGEQQRVVAAVCDEGQELPVVVGISARATAPAVEQAGRASEAAGRPLAAVMVQVNSSHPDVLEPHLRAIHESAAVPVVLQDYPVTSGVHIGVAQILETVRRCPYVVAVKSEAPPTGQVIAELVAQTSVPVFGGLGGVGLLDELAAGAAGAMTGFSCPEALLECLQAWEAGGMAAAHAAYARWLPLANFEAQPGIGLALRKEAFRLREVFASGSVRPPSPPFPEAFRPIMQQHRLALGLDRVSS